MCKKNHKENGDGVYVLHSDDFSLLVWLHNIHCKCEHDVSSSTINWILLFCAMFCLVHSFFAFTLFSSFCALISHSRPWTFEYIHIYLFLHSLSQIHNFVLFFLKNYLQINLEFHFLPPPFHSPLSFCLTLIVESILSSHRCRFGHGSSKTHFNFCIRIHTNIRWWQS